MPAPTAAASQIATNSKAPIDITANTAEVQAAKCLAIWRGSAEALQAKARLRADTISVYSRPKGTSASGQPDCGPTDRIVAEGHVFYVTADQSARANHAVYSAGDDEIVMTGDVVVVQGQNVSSGNKLTIKVSTATSGDGRADRRTCAGRDLSQPRRRRRSGLEVGPTMAVAETFPEASSRQRAPPRRRAKAWWSTGSARRSAAVRSCDR